MSHIVVKDLRIDNLFLGINEQHSIATTLYHSLALPWPGVVRPLQNIKHEIPVNKPNHPVVHISHDVVGIMLSFFPIGASQIILSSYGSFRGQIRLINAHQTGLLHLSLRQ